MPLTSGIVILFFTSVSVAAAGIIVMFLTYFNSTRRQTARALMREGEASTVFLFDGDMLMDATTSARQLLGRKDPRETDLDAVFALLSRRFPDLREKLAGLATNGRVIVTSTEPSGIVEAELWDGLMRLTLRHQSTEVAPLQRLAIEAIEDELQTLRSIGEDAPQLIWKQDDTATITWANRAYLNLADRINPIPEGSEPIWPPGVLFTETGPTPDGPKPLVRRHALRVPGQTQEQWYEVTSMRRGSETLHFAVDANGIVRAEQAQKAFVQTLAKTFAHLSTGLAIFDRQRRLVLFNPALLDLTGLPVTFLSSRPMVHSVLDRLRDMNMLPEPKNYASWRDQVLALETAATRGTYCETWNLPGGQTYRVTGRPHPDGAIAFLFEDISAEVSLTRHFRQEIETAQSVIDSLDEAIAVFSSSGTLTMSNAAYTKFWGPSADAMEEIGLQDELRRWQDRCAPTAVWGDLRGFVEGFGERTEWFDDVTLENGQLLSCRFTPLPHGTTLVGFTPGPGAMFQQMTAPPSAQAMGLNEPTEPLFRHKPRRDLTALA
jgi:PAS domain-containing protein